MPKDKLVCTCGSKLHAVVSQSQKTWLLVCDEHRLEKGHTAIVTAIDGFFTEPNFTARWNDSLKHNVPFGHLAGEGATLPVLITTE